MSDWKTHAYGQCLQTKLKGLRDQAIKDDLPPDKFDEMCRQVCSELHKPSSNSVFIILGLVGVGLALCGTAVQYARTSLYYEACLIDSHILPKELTRPVADCSMCSDLTTVPRYDAITRDEFELKHAYTNRPAIVRHAATNWTAVKTLDFRNLKELYSASDIDEIQDDCAFFAYRTGFVSLKDAFESITPEMENLEDGATNWYIGWSNCDKSIRGVLDQISKKPYFLPERSRSYSTWFFVGSPGIGAGIHIDDVELPSWQAQIMGSKTWTLTPPPECEHMCQTINATLHQGDIIVVDTNQWYHSTTIHEGSISLSIGSEYD